MNIAGSVALVTGANRGPGKALVAALLSFGAAKVYAGGGAIHRRLRILMLFRYNSMSVHGSR